MYHVTRPESSLVEDPPPPDVPRKGPESLQDATRWGRWPSGRSYRVGAPTGLTDRDIYPWLPEDPS
jgi:hypothetical protein